ncbi:hypothetical protein N7527_010486 [Penicillium freii]|uniref:Uncharacterized protein n=1 Tax=Penicillium freii TaxID=48697 RepID=A0A101MA99_PENFR|nr:hypothetical protein N7527_010486 [Penicillium freii]KUM56864.1 hypothetical protein ACN42_g10339 [Penicillium freii]
MFPGDRSVALRASLRPSTPEAHTGDLGFVLDRHYVDPPLSRVTTIPTLRLPPQLTLWTSIITPFALPTYALSLPQLFIRLPYPHAPASLSNSFALLVLTHSFASSHFQNECST